MWKRKKKNYCKKHIFEITKEKYLRTETYDYNVKKDYYAIYSKCLLCKEEKIEEFPRNKRIDMNGYEVRLWERSKIMDCPTCGNDMVDCGDKYICQGCGREEEK